MSAQCSTWNQYGILRLIVSQRSYIDRGFVCKDNVEVMVPYKTASNDPFPRGIGMKL